MLRHYPHPNCDELYSAISGRPGDRSGTCLRRLHASTRRKPIVVVERPAALDEEWLDFLCVSPRFHSVAVTGFGFAIAEFRRFWRRHSSRADARPRADDNSQLQPLRRTPLL